MYKYTNPDVIRYRRNQRWLLYATYVVSCVPALVMWAGLKHYEEKYMTTETPTTEE